MSKLLEHLRIERPRPPRPPDPEPPRPPGPVRIQEGTEPYLSFLRYWRRERSWGALEPAVMRGEAPAAALDEEGARLAEILSRAPERTRWKLQNRVRSLAGRAIGETE